MAYNAVPTKSTGNTWTATENNTYIKDNFASGVPDIFTTKGDLAVGTGANAVTRLGVGTNGTLLTAASGETSGLSWSAINSAATAYARYTRTTTQTIGTGAYTIIDYATSVFDTDSAVTTGAAWKFTVPADHGGYYLVCASAYLESSAAWEVNEVALLALYVDGTIVCRLATVVMQAAGTYTQFISGSAIVSVAAASYIDVRLYQDSDSNAVITNDGTLSHIAIAKLI